MKPESANSHCRPFETTVYTIVPTAVSYCTTKFFVSAFSEGLARELKEDGYPLEVKVLAPAATETEFGKIANEVDEYSYDKCFKKYHTAEQVAELLLKLYDSEKVIGAVDRETFEFKLLSPRFSYSGSSPGNQDLKNDRIDGG